MIKIRSCGSGNIAKSTIATRMRHEIFQFTYFFFREKGDDHEYKYSTRVENSESCQEHFNSLSIRCCESIFLLLVNRSKAEAVRFYFVGLTNAEQFLNAWVDIYPIQERQRHISGRIHED